MANNPRNKENLKPFKKGPDERRNQKGQPNKNLVAQVNAKLKAQGYEQVSNSEVTEAQQLIINLPLSKVAAIAQKNIMYKDGEQVVYLSEGDEYPLFYRLIAKELMSKNGGDYLEKILDRAYGRATQAIDHNITSEQPLFPDIKPNE